MNNSQSIHKRIITHITSRFVQARHLNRLGASKHLLYWAMIGFAMSLFGITTSFSVISTQTNQLKEENIMYGPELVIDLYDCDVSKFSRRSLKEFFENLCEEINMTPCKLTFWDDKWTWLWKLLFFWDKTIQYATSPHTDGTSAVQFIITSNVTVHTLNQVRECYINIFSCKDFNIIAALDFTTKWFSSSQYEHQTLQRGRKSKCKLPS